MDRFQAISTVVNGDGSRVEMLVKYEGNSLASEVAKRNSRPTTYGCREERTPLAFVNAFGRSTIPNNPYA
ncbi:MAG: hypothetical protein U1E46_02895 [Hyphomicrobiales bacterium]